MAKVFPFHATALRADPTRNRIYATQPDTASVAVIDTVALSVVATIPVGSRPSDLAISPDGNTLYVSSAGSADKAVSVVDLNTLQSGRTLALPAGALALAVGLDNRLYVSLIKPNPLTLFPTGTLYQVDAITGTVEAILGNDDYDNTHLQISPDCHTLFASGNENLTAYDVSTSTPSQRQQVLDVALDTVRLILSHDGRFLCLPKTGSGNGGTVLYSTADLTQTISRLADTNAGSAYALSPDDTVMYETSSQSNSERFMRFDTRSGAFLDAVDFRVSMAGYDNPALYYPTVDASGSYLFAIGSSSAANGNSDGSRPELRQDF